jgi:transposase
METRLKNLSKEALLQLILEKEGLILEKETQVRNRDAEIEKKQIEIEHYKLTAEKFKRLYFGSKRERFIKDLHQNQLNLFFEELEAKNENTSKDTVKQTITYTRTKNENHKGRNKLPEDLPVHEVVIEPAGSTEGMKKIGEERTEILELAPAKFFKLVFVRPKYAKAGEEGVVIGELPSRPIEKCLAGNTLLGSILINKYVDHLPLYRQQQIFKRWGIEIAPSTIDGWVSQLGTLLEPLYNAMVNVVKHDGYLQADETPTRVLDKQKKGKCHLGYYWVYHSPPKRMVVFDYQRGRSKDAPQKILNDFQGYLQTDGYNAYLQYHNKKEVTHLACWAHARRYFEQALTQDQSRAEHALEQIQKLYMIEREAKEFNAEQRKEYRLEKSLPIINELGKWIGAENKKVLPKSAIGKAFNYTAGLWDSLQNYLYNGDLLIDNNLIENTIRPNALGRKNYLFAGSDEGAKRTAMFYSFTGTCKLHSVNPMEWLSEVLNKIANHKVNKLHELFPQNLQLPENKFN